jgi:hypothetical protein
MQVEVIVAIGRGQNGSRLLVHDCLCGRQHIFELPPTVTYEGSMLTAFLHDLHFDAPCDLYPDGIYLVPEGSASSLRQHPKSRTCKYGHPMTFKRFKSVPKGRWYCRECQRIATEARRRAAGAVVAGSPEHKAAVSAGQRRRWQNPEHVTPPHLRAGASKGYRWTPDQRAGMVEAALMREAVKRSGIECESCGKRFLPNRSTSRFCSSACRAKSWRQQA